MTVHAPAHRQRSRLIHLRHLVDATMTGLAADALGDVDCMIEVDEIRQLRHALPPDRLTSRDALAHHGEWRAGHPKGRMARDTLARRRQTSPRASIGTRVAIAAVDVQRSSMESMIEGHRLHDTHVFAARPRRAHPQHRQRRRGNENCDCRGQRTPRDYGCAGREECGHDGNGESAYIAPQHATCARESADNQEGGARTMTSPDAIVVGAGPNGLTAAVVLARAGLSVLLVEGASQIGGGARTEALTLPGFSHDVCSAVHPLAAASPVLAALPLADYGLEWVEPPIAVAHPLDAEPPALLARDIATTAHSLGADASAYRSLVDPFARSWAKLAPDILAPLHAPAHPLLLARFGMIGIRSIARLVRRSFSGSQAPA